MALLTGSAAIGAGTAVSGVTTDQRGFPLNPDSTDIGAFKNESSLVVNTTNDGDNAPAGDLTVRQAVNLANVPGAVEAITFDPSVFATPQTITLAGELELGNTSGSETITGPTAGVTISGGSLSRVFAIASGVTATLSGLTFTDGDITNGDGAGLVNEGQTSLTDCTISGNTSDSGNGGGVENLDSGNLTLTDCTISNNSAVRFGGGLENVGPATLILNGCTISANAASISGGGLSNNATGFLTVNDCTFSTNVATSNGGGLSNLGAASLTGCAISGNTAGNDGGGLYNGDSATLPVTDCTLSGNQAGVLGGGLYNGATATLPLTACTVSGNSTQGLGGGLANAGTASLTDTIVASNTRPSAASDIHSSVSLSGSHNLIGTGGSGSFSNGANNNIVLTSLSSLGLAPLGSYGGPTQTVALLPGSAAISAGIAANGVTTDQRGVTIPSTGVDIGAFQSQGFTLTSQSGSTSQVTSIGTPFANRLSVKVTANDPSEPVAGGVISFGAPSNGASAALSSSTATIGSDGVASVTATADTTIGSYMIAATTLGAVAAVDFKLTNQTMPTLTVVDAGGTYNGLAFPARAIVTGASGTGGPSLEGVTPALTYYAGNTATGTPLSTVPLNSGTYTVIAVFPGSASYEATRSAPVTFQINPGTTSVTVTASAGRASYGQAVTFTAVVTAPGGGTPSGTITFSDDGTVLGSAVLDGSGVAMLTVPSLAVGANSITASYAGDINFVSATSAHAAAVAVAPAASRAMLVSIVGLKKKKVVSLELKAEIESPSLGGGVPTGSVVFELLQKKKKPTVLGTASLSAGVATLFVKPTKVLKQSIEVLYSGDAYFQPSTMTTTITAG